MDILIAIDGHAGSGKSSTAQEVASILGYRYINSGLIYRTIALHSNSENIDPKDSSKVESMVKDIDISTSYDSEEKKFRIFLNGNDVTGALRSMDVERVVSYISSYPGVRKKAMQVQRELTKKSGIVVEGRDIGTVVIPNADLKIFMTADVETRTKRRYKQLLEKKSHLDTKLASIEDLKKSIIERDMIDQSRHHSPLKKARDAIEINTSNTSFHDQVSRIVKLAKKIILEKNRF